MAATKSRRVEASGSGQPSTWRLWWDVVTSLGRLVMVLALFTIAIVKLFNDDIDGFAAWFAFMLGIGAVQRIEKLEGRSR